ncbi:biotin--[acetyl-CoA-carboxylase] ligase [Proteiniphilum sp.]|uniref:biotin--[acetyl-CoA-carboxylase] ligase n=1 Tax=Proteiniphilum sp. TaxID=1926877 RepID=UPI002B206BB5|nr:biotin--[acetyl-CoA-carboxylase] ligase [Proteiniphilum sp.]MEA4918677.1 biotin--[acetyl-CoA-carboxylase] ligase [Proteiniphilum sp.]
MELLSKDRKIIRLEETDSTNLYIRSLLERETLEEGSIVIADYQTGGRGQMGNSWYSSKGRNLLFSLLLYPKNLFPRDQFIISRIASLAVKRTLDRFTDNICIKWPNDVYWKERKISGILIENDITGEQITRSIIGIGINVNQVIFPSIIPKPICLKMITHSAQDREYIFDIFQKEFFQLYHDFQNGRIRTIEDEYMHNLYRMNDYYWYEDKNGRFLAKIEDVLPSGRLVLKTNSGEERKYAFKEVSFVD